MGDNLIGTSIRLSKEQIAYCEKRGGKSKYIRNLIERDIRTGKLLEELIVKYGNKGVV